MAALGQTEGGTIRVTASAVRMEADAPVQVLIEWAAPKPVVYLTPAQAELARAMLAIAIGQAKAAQAAIDAQPDAADIAVTPVQGQA
ncbi:MAG: hypothetical protein ACK4RV_11660 [Caulobacter sp.]